MRDNNNDNDGNIHTNGNKDNSYIVIMTMILMTIIVMVMRMIVMRIVLIIVIVTICHNILYDDVTYYDILSHRPIVYDMRCCHRRRYQACV
jgi:hypothetical protein